MDLNKTNFDFKYIKIRRFSIIIELNLSNGFLKCKTFAVFSTEKVSALVDEPRRIEHLPQDF
jgi:hypothetical protein